MDRALKKYGQWPYALYLNVHFLRPIASYSWDKAIFELI